MAEQKPFMIYGNIRTPEEIEQDRIDKEMGIVRYHETTWLEWEIPQELDRIITRYISAKIKKYRQTCQCENCKNDRNHD